MNQGYQGGTYKINVKFGDGAKADRDKAYAGTNPNFKSAFSVFSTNPLNIDPHVSFVDSRTMRKI